MAAARRGRRPARGAGGALARSRAARATPSGCSPCARRSTQGDPRGAIRLLDEEMEVQDGRGPARGPAERQRALRPRPREHPAVHRRLRSLEGRPRGRRQGASTCSTSRTTRRTPSASTSSRARAASTRRRPYEKLLVNTLDMLNYLELRDLDGARVEARRLAVMQKYISDDLHEGDNPVLGLGGLLAGLTFEESGQTDEALRWYDQALPFTGFRVARRPGAAAACSAGQLPLAAPQGARGRRPAAARSRRGGRGGDRLRRGLRARAAQDPAAHPHRSRAHDVRGRHLARQRGEGERARGAGARHVDQLPDARAASRAATPCRRACSTAATCSSRRRST